MILEFTIPGPPKSKARPRVTSRGTFMPTDYREWKKHVATCAMGAPGAREWDAHAQAFRVSVDFYMPTRRGLDVDNLVGGVLDGLNKVLWKDDASVAELGRVRRLYDKANPRAVVRVEGFYVDPWAGVLP